LYGDSFRLTLHLGNHHHRIVHIPHGLGQILLGLIHGWQLIDILRVHYVTMLSALVLEHMIILFNESLLLQQFLLLLFDSQF
jgi:hypothetical protein